MLFTPALSAETVSAGLGGGTRPCDRLGPVLFKHRCHCICNDIDVSPLPLLEIDGIHHVARRLSYKLTRWV
jgi:hypothetical protein